jgi:predicted ATP-grasp superfamily ATP-dependent carboligase
MVSPDDLIYKIGLLTIERDHLIQAVRRLEEQLQRLAGETAEKAEKAAKAAEPPAGKE